jgi:signal transduction histidine kinase
LDTFLGQALAAIAQHLTAPWVILWLYEKSRNLLSLHLLYEHGRIRSAAQLHGRAALQPLPADTIPLWRELTQTRCPVVVENIRRDLRMMHQEWFVAQGVRRAVTAPLLLSDDAIGCLSIGHSDCRPYRREDVELVQMMSHQVAIAFQLTQLTEQRRQDAVREERNRLAREIHDTVAQSLTGIVLHLEAAGEMLTVAPEEARHHMLRAISLARESLAETRCSVGALRLQALERGDLSSVLARLTAQVGDSVRIPIDFRVHGAPRPLPPNLESHLLRISQEALTNACKHAHASAIWIELTFAPQRVRLRVYDNGQGFQIQKSGRGDGFGLVGMRERAERLGGRLILTSNLGRGTDVTVLIPDAATDSALDSL